MDSEGTRDPANRQLRVWMYFRDAHKIIKFSMQQSQKLYFYGYFRDAHKIIKFSMQQSQKLYFYGPKIPTIRNQPA